MTSIVNHPVQEMALRVSKDEQARRNVEINHLIRYLIEHCPGEDIQLFTDQDGRPDPVSARQYAEALRQRLTGCYNAMFIGIKLVGKSQVRLRFITDPDHDPEGASDAILRREQITIVS